MKTTLFYFGCIRESGHYLWESGEYKYYAQQMARKIPNLNPMVLECLDGVYPPMFQGHGEIEGFYQESIVPPVRIVAWWDRSVDKRGACNSALVGYGFDNAEAMLDAAVTEFPSVMKRQPRPKSFSDWKPTA